MDRKYLCIDLKSFFASVECVERGLDPMTTNLVVADPERSDKTICLAITPAMKALGIRNRCRIFEIPPGVDYIVAPPRMKKYMEYSAAIYAVYLRYVSGEDIHVYSIDEVFIDVTNYLTLYRMTARQLAVRMMEDVYREIGVRAACGIGSNLYLTKIALDITAKHAADFIGELNEESYRQGLWDHKPITDFWRIGPGTARRLHNFGIDTMRDVANAPEDLLYRLFGIDAELLIDHAWGREPTTIADIKNYHAKTNCLTSGQVLMRDYGYDEARLVLKEMVDALCLEMVDKGVVTRSLGLMVGYSNALHMEPVHGSISLELPVNSDRILIEAAERLFERIVDPQYPIRRLNITCNHVVEESCEQCSLFVDQQESRRTRQLQTAVLDIKKKYGKNAILKGMSLEEAATARERNRQIGGHKSGE
ncbi:MAG: DNA repair protein [Oscillospiraceae bacterium]|nr:DNA repair protein [Oscillospiraceae bacterium]